MKKYITLDFDEKGAPVMGNAKNTPGQGYAFVPSGWVPPTPPTPVEEGDGIKSLAISPTFVTDPTLEDQFPVYWDDERLAPDITGVKTFSATAEYMEFVDASYTFTPAATWYMIDPVTEEPVGGAGEPYTTKAVDDGGDKKVTAWAVNTLSNDVDDFKMIQVTIALTNGK